MQYSDILNIPSASKIMYIYLFTLCVNIYLVTFIFQLETLKLPALRKVIAKEQSVVKAKNAKKIKQFGKFCMDSDESDDESELNVQVCVKGTSSSSSSSSSSTETTKISSPIRQPKQPTSSPVVPKIRSMDTATGSGSETELEEDDEDELVGDDLPKKSDKLSLQEQQDTVIDAATEEEESNAPPPPDNPPQTTRNPSVQFADDVEVTTDLVQNQQDSEVVAKSEALDENTQAYDLVSSDSDSEADNICAGISRISSKNQNQGFEEATQV